MGAPDARPPACAIWYPPWRCSRYRTIDIDDDPSSTRRGLTYLLRTRPATRHADSRHPSPATPVPNPDSQGLRFAMPAVPNRGQGGSAKAPYQPYRVAAIGVWDRTPVDASLQTRGLVVANPPPGHSLGQTVWLSLPFRRPDWCKQPRGTGGDHAPLRPTWGQPASVATRGSPLFHRYSSDVLPVNPTKVVKWAARRWAQVVAPRVYCPAEATAE